MAEHNETGKRGEEIAADYLSEKGYEILDRNWIFGKEEIDILAQKDGLLVVAEVKTRSGSFFGDPHEFVTMVKRKHLIKAANAYLERKKLDLEVRFDVIGITINGDKHKINHIEDAFYPVA